MALQQLNTHSQQAPANERSYFTSASWLSYFEENRQNRASITFPQAPSIPLAVRLPLIRSLQRFQIGETGEGKHLKKYAATIGDPDYEKCIDLFIKEEQSHARILAEMIGAMDGELLTWHWSDIAFIALRRMLGLKTELFILLIAEIIGKCFYRRCADHLQDHRMSTAFSLIVLDEIGHLEFHSSFLHAQTKHLGRLLTYIVLFIWSCMFYASCLVFIFDHGAALSACGVSARDFLHDCGATFKRAAQRAFTQLPVNR